MQDVRDLLKCLAFRPQTSRLFLFLELASVSHGSNVVTGCDSGRRDTQTVVKLRTAAVVGFAVGYYLGAKAGRERYEQMRRLLDRAGPVSKVRAAVELGRERLREANEPDVLDSVVRPSSN